MNEINQKRLSHLGVIIREYRFCNGLTQLDLADAAGIHYNTIRRLENSKGNITLNTLFQLADALEIDLSDLFSDIY